MRTHPAPLGPNREQPLSRVASLSWTLYSDAALRRWGPIPLATRPTPQKQTREDASLPDSHAHPHIHPHTHAARLTDGCHRRPGQNLGQLEPGSISPVHGPPPAAAAPPPPLPRQPEPNLGRSGVPLAISQHPPLGATQSHSPQTFVPEPPGTASQTR